MLHRSEIKAMAKEKIKGNVWTIFFALLVAGIVAQLGSLAFGIGVIITMPAMYVGICIFTLSVWRDEDVEFGKIFKGFDNLGRNIGGVLLVGLFVSLWSLLLIVPGIIMALAYSMTNFIMADTECTAGDALRTSKEMTKGYRGDIFVMGLSFLGWALLGSLTFGLAYIYAMPYMAVSYAGLYDELKKNAIEKGTWNL